MQPPIGRNDSCYCGSNNKYKKCCLSKDQRQMMEDFYDDDRKSAVDKLLRAGNRFLEKKPQSVKTAYALFWPCIADKPDKLPEKMLELCEGIFNEWLLIDYTPTDGLRVIEQYLADDHGKLTEKELEVLHALTDSYRNFYEIQKIEPEKGLRIKDLLTEKIYFVSERRATRSATQWDILYARLLITQEKITFSGEVVCVDRRKLDLVQDLIKQSAKGTRKKTILIQKNFKDDLPIILGELMIPDQPPILHTTTGEKMIFCTGRYRMLDQDIIEHALRKNGELEKTDNQFLWLNEKQTILAHLRYQGDNLIVETNSRERYQKATKKIIMPLTKWLKKETEEFKMPEEVTSDISHQDLPESAKIIPNPEEEKILEDYLDKHYQSILDEKIPLLDNQTPREAIRTEKGKRQMEELFKLWENGEQHQAKRKGVKPYDFSKIRKMLNLM